MTTHYIMAPFSTASNLFQNTLGMNQHRMFYTNKGSEWARVQPIFVSQDQCKHFNRLAEEYLASFVLLKNDENVLLCHKIYAEQMKLATSLVEVSTPSQAQGELPDEKDQVLYVQGHGDAGQYFISDDTGDEADIDKIIAGLEQINAVGGSRKSCIMLKINSCYSGAANYNIFPSRKDLLDWVIKAQQATEADKKQVISKDSFFRPKEIGSFNTIYSLAALLLWRLHQKGLSDKLKLYGYVSSTTIKNIPYNMVENNGGAQYIYDPHMGVELIYRAGDIEAPLNVRKKLARVEFAFSDF